MIQRLRNAGLIERPYTGKPYAPALGVVRWCAVIQTVSLLVIAVRL